MEKANEKFKKALSIIMESKKLIISIAICIVVLAVALSFLFPKERKVTTIVESSLKEVMEVCELSTVEFIYNSTVTVVDEKSNPKYHVAYEGTVKAGFNLDGIKAETDSKNKKIAIIFPKIKINSVNIDDESLDYIFVKNKYDTETTFQEAYKLCYEDLEKKAQDNETIKKMAFENAVDSMKAILTPLEARLPNGYTFDFREESDIQ